MNNQFERDSIHKDNREIFTLASIYYNRDCTKGSHHSGTTCYSTHPYRPRIIPGELTCHVIRRKPSWVIRKFPFDQYDRHSASTLKRKKKKKKSFTARSTMYQHGVLLVYGVRLSAREKAETYAFPRLHPHGSYVKAERGAAHYWTAMQTPKRWFVIGWCEVIRSRQKRSISSSSRTSIYSHHSQPSHGFSKMPRVTYNNPQRIGHSWGEPMALVTIYFFLAHNYLSVSRHTEYGLCFLILILIFLKKKKKKNHNFPNGSAVHLSAHSWLAGSKMRLSTPMCTRHLGLPLRTGKGTMRGLKLIRYCWPYLLGATSCLLVRSTYWPSQ